MADDCAIMCRLIPGADPWRVVFTRSGRYFFHNPTQRLRTWLPLAPLLTLLQTRLTDDQRAILFDPFSDEEVLISADEDEDKDEDETLALSLATFEQDNDPRTVADSQIVAEETFKTLLVDRDVDPFAPWPDICAQLTGEPAFVAVTTERRRQELFASLCPMLIEKRRALRTVKLQEAQAWWQTVVQTARRGQSWIDFSRKLRLDRRFSLLNAKECERDFKRHAK